MIVKALRDIPVPDIVYNESASDGTRGLSHVYFVCTMLVLQCATPVILSGLILSLMYNTCFFRKFLGKSELLAAYVALLINFVFICKAVGELLLSYIVTIA